MLRWRLTGSSSVYTSPLLSVVAAVEFSSVTPAVGVAPVLFSVLGSGLMVPVVSVGGGVVLLSSSSSSSSSPPSSDDSSDDWLSEDSSEESSYSEDLVCLRSVVSLFSSQPSWPSGSARSASRFFSWGTCWGKSPWQFNSCLTRTWMKLNISWI